VEISVLFHSVKISESVRPLLVQLNKPVQILQVVTSAPVYQVTCRKILEGVQTLMSAQITVVDVHKTVIT
jgi:hypothetical protein